MATFEPMAPGERAGLACLVVTAGVGLVDTLDRIKQEVHAGWAVEVVATPLAAEWMVAGQMLQPIEELTGSPVQHRYRSPWDPKPARMYNKCIASPVTLNSLTKWADGHADNLALSMLCEAIGTDGVPVIAYLTLNGAYANHPAANPAINVIRDAGVDIQPYEPGEKMKAILRTYKPNQLADNLAPHRK